MEVEEVDLWLRWIIDFDIGYKFVWFVLKEVGKIVYGVKNMNFFLWIMVGLKVVVERCSNLVVVIIVLILSMRSVKLMFMCWLYI